MKDHYGFEQPQGLWRAPARVQRRALAPIRRARPARRAVRRGRRRLRRRRGRDDADRGSLRPRAGAGALSARRSCSAAGACATARAAEQREALIPQIAAGELRMSLAHAERASGWDLFDVADERAEGRRRLCCSSGEKGLVLHGDSAQKLIVLARTAGGAARAGGLGLFLVDADVDRCRAARLSDAGRHARGGDHACRRPRFR